jgi:hypothetical protein
MALDATKLSPVGTGAGQKLWLYTSATDTTATMKADNYFILNSVPLMVIGDIILGSCTTTTVANMGSVKLMVSAIAAATGSTVRSLE